MNTDTLSNIVEMPIEERIQFVEDVWNSIAKSPDSVEIPQWHKQELETRLQSYLENPNAGATWQDVKKKILD